MADITHPNPAGTFGIVAATAGLFGSIILIFVGALGMIGGNASSGFCCYCC